MPRTSKKKILRRRILKTMGIVFGIIALLWIAFWIFEGRFLEYTDDAYVSGNLVRLMPQVQGTVVSINADDTELVMKGQVLVKLDETDARIAMEKAQANLAETVRQVRQEFEDIKQSYANLKLTRVLLEEAQYDSHRREGLVAVRAISHEEMQHYTSRLKAAEATWHAAKARYQANLALVENTTLYTHPAVKQAIISFKNAYLNDVRTTIISPVTGYIANRTVQLGQQVSPRTSLMAIVPMQEMWIEANYKESQLTRLRIGQPVSLRIDAYDGFEFHGKVHGLSSGTGSAFDLLPPQNATGNWIKIVQRIPVRIDMDPKEIKEHPLRIGLSVRVTTNTAEIQGDILNPVAHTEPLYVTAVFASQLQNVDRIVTQTLNANSPNYALVKAKREDINV